jgi:hypothetical protein
MICKIEIGNVLVDATDFVVQFFVHCNRAHVNNEGFLNDGTNSPQGGISSLLVKLNVVLDVLLIY